MSELDAAGQRAEIFLVGGAAIALCFDGHRATRDLDAAERCGQGLPLFSSPVEADAEDIALLYRAVGYHTVDVGLNLVERSYPGRPIVGKVQFLLEEIVQSLDAE